MTRPGIEPGSAAGEATILPLDHSGGQKFRFKLDQEHMGNPTKASVL